jgi:hypothetical protein
MDENLSHSYLEKIYKVSRRSLGRILKDKEKILLKASTLKKSEIDQRYRLDGGGKKIDNP